MIASEYRTDQGECVINNVGDFGWAVNDFVLPGKSQQVTDNFSHTLGFMNNASGEFAESDLSDVKTVMNMLSIIHDTVDRVVYLVGHPAGQCAN